MDAPVKGERIINYIYEAIGHTPMLRLQKIPKDEGIECEILAKCEFMNPGGSVKDRVSMEMFLQAETEGRIKPGDTVVEATSGNAGIGFCLMAACKGYKMVITIPDRMSLEKISVLKSLGAEVIRTPSGVPGSHPASSYSMARTIQKERPNSHNLDQYVNPANPNAHYKTTGQEIFEDCGGKLDYVFMGVGTGGTITGVSRKLKELNPNIKIIGIDPMGSIMAEPMTLNTVKKGFHVEGIGHDFIPDVLDRSTVDSWVKTDDAETFRYARDLISKEGLLSGASSGSVVEGMVKYLKEHGLDKNPNVRCVIILPDSIRNYLSKFCSDDWMVKKGFYEPSKLLNSTHPLYGMRVSDLGLVPVMHFEEKNTIKEALDYFSRGEMAAPIFQDGKLVGLATRQSVMHGLLNKTLKPSDSITKAVSKEAVSVDYETDVSIFDALLKTEEVVFATKQGTHDRCKEVYAVTPLEIIKLLNRVISETEETNSN